VRIPALNLGVGTQSTETVALQGLVTSMWRQNHLGSLADHAEGQIGTQILKHFVVTFDYAHSRMRLVPNRQFADPFLYNRAGFTVDVQDDKYIVTDVVPNNPAALAGIQNGDAILSLNGISMKEIMAADDDTYAPLRKPVGTVVRVVRQRGGEPPVETQVVLRDQL
jgi:predicted metalloprotease with PDZ domain